jgi:hypothetical protein
MAAGTAPTTAVLFLALCTGCTTLTRAPIPIVRDVPVPVDDLEASISTTATARNFHNIGGVWERTVSHEKDPVLGLITVTDRTEVGLRFTPSIEPKTEKTCRLTVVAVLAIKRFLSSKYDEGFLLPGGPEYTEIETLLDTAIAEAITAAEGSGTPKAAKPKTR